MQSGPAAVESPPEDEIPPPPNTAVPAPATRETLIGRTLGGLALLVVAVLLSWIPIIEYLGLLIGAIGVIQIFRGRQPFGAWHEGLVWTSIWLFVVSYLALLALTAGFVSAVERAGFQSSGPAAATTFLAAWDGFIAGAVVLASLISVSYSLIAFKLEDLPGRLMLLTAVVAQVGISTALFVYVFNPLIHHAVTQAFATTPPDLAVLAAAEAQVQGLSGLKLLDAIPALLFAGAYVRAYHRILRRVTPPSERPTAPESRTETVLLVAILVLVVTAGVAALAFGGLNATPRPPPTWVWVADLAGSGLNATHNFTITGSQFRLTSLISTNSLNGYSFSFDILRAGTGQNEGGCGSFGGPDGYPMSYTGSCGPFSGAGTYYVLVIAATGIGSWGFTVEQLA